MYYKMETEFANVNDFEIRDTYFGFRNLPFLQSLTIGNQKRPFGLDHLNSSRYNVFIARPDVVEAFNEDARRLGIASYGVSDDLRYNWRYGVWNLERIQDDGIYIGDSYQLQAAGRLATTYWWDEPSEGRGYGHFAVSGAVADPDETGGPQNNNEARFRTRPEARTAKRWLNTGRIDDVERFDILGLEHVFNYGALQWTSEVQGLWNNRNDGSEDADFWGGYTYVSYFLTGEHLPWSRESGTLGRVKPHENFFLVNACDGERGGGWGAWQVAARYSHIDLNDADVFGGESDSVTLGLNWYWNQNANMQFNYVIGRINDSAVVDGVGGAGDPIAESSKPPIFGSGSTSSSPNSSPTSDPPRGVTPPRLFTRIFSPPASHTDVRSPTPVLSPPHRRRGAAVRGSRPGGPRRTALRRRRLRPARRPPCWRTPTRQAVRSPGPVRLRIERRFRTGSAVLQFD